MSTTPAARTAAVWLAIVFLLGAGLGAVVGFGVSRHSTASAAPAETESVRRAHMVERLDQELHLTDSQRATLNQILTGLQAQYKSIHLQINPQIDDARQKARGQIREILTPEQKPKFEDFLRRFDEEHKRRGSQ
jgi:Spy/CpxP family protein refolding chaperone